MKEKIVKIIKWLLIITNYCKHCYKDWLYANYKHMLSMCVCFIIKNILTDGFPVVCPGHLQIGTWSRAKHSAFLPQMPGVSHGFVHLLSMQAAEFGQSESVKQSPGCLQPVLNGSPIKPCGQTQAKDPSVFWHLLDYSIFYYKSVHKK